MRNALLQAYTLMPLDKLEWCRLVIPNYYICLHVSSYDPDHLLGTGSSYPVADEQSSNFGNFDHHCYICCHWRVGICNIHQFSRIISRVGFSRRQHPYSSLPERFKTNFYRKHSTFLCCPHSLLSVHTASKKLCRRDHR